MILCFKRLLCFSLLYFMHYAYAKNKHDGPPIIKEHPTSVITRRNVPVTLNCAASGDAEIRWFRDGIPVLSRDGGSRNRLINIYRGTLYFTRVNVKNDVGTYWCVATNNYGSVRSKNATLSVATLGDHFLQEPHSFERVELGKSLILSCRPPKGTPAPNITWKHNDRVIDGDSRINISADGEMTIKEVNGADSGVYVCVAQNYAGTRESVASTVIVLQSPWFEIRPMNVSTVAGDTVEFHCKARGNPLPSVTWRSLDGKMLLNKIEILKERDRLRITDVSASDSGIYVCEAKNEVGSAMSLASLKVVVAPEMKEKPTDVTSVIGKKLTLKCEVDGDPKPLIVWRLPHQQRNVLTENQANSHASVSRNGTSLEVGNLDMEDNGSYYCWGISSGGAVSSRAKVLVLKSLPPPLIGVRPVDQHVAPGSKISFPCEYTSEVSEAAVSWWFQKAAHLPVRELTYKGPRELLLTGTLIIKHVTEADSGIYTCRVSSESGSVEAEAILIVDQNIDEFKAVKYNSNLGVPFPPSKPRIHFYNGSSVHLSWLPNSARTSGKVDSYIVEYWKSPWQEWRVAQTEILDTSTTLSNVLPNTAYVFLVRAVNAYGESFPSPWSEIIYTTSENELVSLDEERQIRRKLSKPTVTLLSAKPSSSNDIVLTWGQLDTEERDIDGILIYSLGAGRLETATVIGSTSNSHLVRDLRPNTPYTFFLVPFSKAIEGVPSNSIIFNTSEKAPDVAPSGLSVEIFKSGTTLVKWQPLTAMEARGNVIGYRVSITHNNETKVKGTQNTWLEVRDLVDGSLYTVRVAGISGGGVGPWSSPELIDISSIVPSGNQNSDGNENIPSVFYAPPHPAWLLYLLVPIVIFLIVITLIYVRKVRYKSAPSTLDPSNMGPTIYSSSGVYTPSHQVNMYGEQKIWRPTDSDHDSSLSSARLIRQEHLANEYAEPKIQRLASDSAEPYATTALLAPASPHIVRTPSNWRHGRCSDDIQVNWAALIPPPPTCPPPLNFPTHNESGETCSSGSTSVKSGERRHYYTGSSSQYENAGGSEEYERPCDMARCDLAADHTYEVYAPVSRDGQITYFQTFNTLQTQPVKMVTIEVHPNRGVPPKSNTH